MSGRVGLGISIFVSKALSGLATLEHLFAKGGKCVYKNKLLESLAERYRNILYLDN